MEGSVLGSGTKLQINARLVQVADEVPLWAERFDRDVKSSSDVFAILDEISRAVANKLRLTWVRGQRRYDLDLETYELYLKGRVLVGRRGIPNLEKAADLFQQVLAKDPAFAPAHAGLANAFALMSDPISSSLPFETAHAILRPAAVKARELDPLLTDAHAAMGWVYSRERDWANAEKAFQQATELNPSLTETYTNYSSSTLQPLGKLDEALRILRVALRNDPLSLDVQREIGVVQFLAGRYGEAIDTFQRVRAVEPDFPFVESWLGRALTLAGRLAEAVPMLEKLDGHNLGRFKAPQARRAPWLARAYVMTGRRAEAETLVVGHEDSPSGLAIIYAALGDKDRTFEALEQMAVVQPHHVGRMLINPEMAVLRGDPRLAALRKNSACQPNSCDSTISGAARAEPLPRLYCGCLSIELRDAEGVSRIPHRAREADQNPRFGGTATRCSSFSSAARVDALSMPSDYGYQLKRPVVELLGLLVPSTAVRSRDSASDAAARGHSLEASEMLRGLIEAIVLTPGEGPLRIELRGNLAAMLTAAQQTKRSPDSGDLLVPVQLVAGARNPLNLEFSWSAA